MRVGDEVGMSHSFGDSEVALDGGGGGGAGVERQRHLIRLHTVGRMMQE